MQIYRANFPKDKRMRKFFNMIEVTLAIAVVGLGMAGIMALFPVGFQASRDAIGDNYASNAAEQFMSYFSRVCINDPNFWDNYIRVAGIESRPSISDETGCTVPVEGNIYKHSTVSKVQVYTIKAGSLTVTDFHATVLIWQSKIKNMWFYNHSEDLPYEVATRINVEISWPYEKPYAQREKRYYTIELFNNKY